MKAILLALLLVGVGIGKRPSTDVRQRCEMIEVSHIHSELPPHNRYFTQLIFWDWSRALDRYVVADYVIVDNSREPESYAKYYVQKDAEGVTAIFTHKSQVYTVRAVHYRETANIPEQDPEMLNRSLVQQGDRRNFFINRHE